MKTVFYLLDKYVHPALRRELVLNLYRMGLKMSDIARMTGYSKSLISRYIRGERGALIDPSMYPDVRRMLEDLALSIVEEKYTWMDIELVLSKIAIYMMKKRYLCVYHRRIERELNLSNCMICPRLFK